MLGFEFENYIVFVYLLYLSVSMCNKIIHPGIQSGSYKKFKWYFKILVTTHFSMNDKLIR